jgi:ribonuclease G
MAKEICISSTPHETRLAILEDDQLSEIYYERENEYTLAGSIYNGRVTRVLPGMQSAFVDLGLERDAFLYVTDFIELEDQEDTDELEQAASTPQAPREIRHTQEPAKRSRPEERAPQREPRPERQPREPEIEAKPPIQIEETVETSADAAQAAEDAEGGSTAGGKRWRGRRHRRGRGQGAPREEQNGGEAAGSESVEGGEPQAITEEFQAEEQVAEPRYQRQEPEPQRERTPISAAPTKFLLPGESLSKYGGAPPVEAKEAKPEEPAAPARPAYTARPSTLIEIPLDWDPSSGLLPGESISRRRGPEPVEEVEEEEAQPSLTALPEPEEAADELEEEELVTALEPVETWKSSEAESAEDEDDEEFEEETSELAGVEAGAPEGEEAEPEEKLESSEDASAAHRVDPSAPSGFRLFGFGKKKEEPKAQPVSTYAPGAGHVEEELIDGEEVDSTPHRRHRQDAHDHDADSLYEEETVRGKGRKSPLGEALEDAGVDQRIAAKFGRGGEDEDDLDVDEEEETGGETTAAPGQQRRAGSRDRNSNARRGRGAPPPRRGPSRRSMQTSDLPIISDLLKPGQEILVQIAKEPIAKKGARITSHIALPGRFLVFMPTVSHVGVSRKIESDEERHRLKRILVNERGDAGGGFIVRTAAEGISEEELRADLRFLMNLWNDIKQRSESSKSPALIYHDLSLVERILRDQVSDNFSNIWVDSEADYERIVRFLNRFSPTLVRRVKLYNKQVPLFEHFGIEDEISKALRSKVWLKSGGSIVINQTEALVAIDINTGKYVGKSARLEDTILKTNLDAVPEIVRQIRLRDLGGIIVIDFIDMDERKNRFKVMAALEEALKNDRAPTKVLQFNDFGLVAITRKRVKQSLERTLSVPCYTCQATGMVKSPATVCNEVYVELRKMKKHFEGADVMLRVHPETVKMLKANNGRWLVDYEELIGKNVLVKSDPTLHPEQFDIQG